MDDVSFVFMFVTVSVIIVVATMSFMDRGQDAMILASVYAVVVILGALEWIRSMRS